VPVFEHRRGACFFLDVITRRNGEAIKLRQQLLDLRTWIASRSLPSDRPVAADPLARSDYSPIPARRTASCSPSRS
jgi:hypothetical protein